MPIFDRLKSILAGSRAEPTAPPRLESASEAALAQSLRSISSEERGWITMQEARRMFSPMDEQYAFGETDDEGRANLARFEQAHGVRADIMPVEGRIYFTPGAR
jgi:hypothetical protein